MNKVSIFGIFVSMAIVGSVPAFAKCPDLSGNYEITAINRFDSNSKFKEEGKALIAVSQKDCSEVTLIYSSQGDQPDTISRHLMTDGKTPEVTEILKPKRTITYSYFEFKGAVLEGRELIQRGNLLPEDLGTFEQISLDEKGNLRLVRMMTTHDGEEKIVQDVRTQRN